MIEQRDSLWIRLDAFGFAFRLDSFRFAFGCIWIRLATFGHVWTHLDSPPPFFWTRLDFGYVWIRLGTVTHGKNNALSICGLLC